MASKRQRVAAGLVSLAWAVNGCILIAMTFAVLANRQISLVIDLYLGREVENILLLSANTRVLATMIGLKIAIFTGTIIVVGLICGPTKHRSLRRWLAFTALFAAWLGLLVSNDDLSWTGQRWRIANVVHQFEPLVHSLHRDWPIADDATPELGPFSAYPNGAPRIVMPLLAPRARGNHAPFSVVERSIRGALRFELLGNDQGAWLEWHPAGSRPASFVGGLDTEYRLLRASELGDGWYLTRYKAEGLSKSL